MAHRGGAIEHLENTLPAFQACVDLGYRYLETDVRVTADGVLVVFHDPTLERVTDRTGRIEHLLLVGGVDGADRRPGADPRGWRTCSGAWPDVRFNLDIKAAGVLAPLVRTVRRLKVTDRICLGSFSDARIAAARRLFGPAVCTALGPARGRGAAAVLLLPPGRRPGPHPGRLSPRCRCSWAAGRWSTSGSSPPPTPATCRCTSGPSTPRTEATAMLDLGVDGVMTDRPAMLQELLEKRGQWFPR